MKRADYLDVPEVLCFTNWLSHQLRDDASLRHEYEIRRRPTRRFSFERLSDAVKKYEWKFSVRLPSAQKRHTGRSYEENRVILDKLQTGLREALKNAVDTSSKATENQLRDWAIAVVKWGGVTNGNKEWLEKNNSQLKSVFQKVGKQLSNDDDAIKIVRFNAGMSKIYSLPVEDFIIYDSRVAAALKWLTAVWCRSTRKQLVPDELSFLCIPFRGGADS